MRMTYKCPHFNVDHGCDLGYAQGLRKYAVNMIWESEQDIRTLTFCPMKPSICYKIEV